MDLYCLCDNYRYHNRNYYNSEADRQFSYRLVETSDGLRRYTFDENTLTVSSKINSYSKLYGYSYKNNTLALQDSGNTKYYTVTIKGSEIVISSADSDSPEILHRVE